MLKTMSFRITKIHAKNADLQPEETPSAPALTQKNLD